MKYYNQTGLCKSDCVADYVLNKYFYKDAPPVKILLFAHHIAVLDVFSERFAAAVSHILLNVLMMIILEFRRSKPFELMVESKGLIVSRRANVFKRMNRSVLLS